VTPDGYVTDVEWQMITVRSSESGRISTDYTDFCKAWKTGHPGLVGYGATLDEAITALLNKHGETPIPSSGRE
jgi:hypothetical protein